MSKRLILSAALALGFALSLSTSAFAKMEDKDVYFGGSAKETSVEFVQMRVRGTLSEMPSTTAPTTLAITSGGKTYLVDVTSTTVIVRLYNGKSNLTEFTLGDDLEVLGTPTDTGSIKAKILKNRSIHLTNTRGVLGDIKSIDADNKAFVFTWKGKDYNVKVDADTKIMIPGIKSKAAISDLKVGDRAQGRAVYNSSTQTYLAKHIVVIRRDGVDLLKKAAKEVNKNGTLSKIYSTALPATIEMTKDGKTYKINITSKTVIMRKHFGKSDLSEFKVGDKIRVIGKTTASDKTVINAQVLKNDSLKSLDELKVDTDQDGVPDARDAKPDDHDNDGTTDDQDADDDNDGIADKDDKKKHDHDNDGTQDKKDNDDDNDGIADSSEASGKQFDHDNDGTQDKKDNDDDNDGIKDEDEPKNQFDHDNDGKRDDKDDDDDSDGINDDDEIGDQDWDRDNDGIKDDKDMDDDNDGIEENNIIRITYHTAFDGHPSVSGNRIVWERMVNGDTNFKSLYMYDLTTRTEKGLEKVAPAPVISGDKIVYGNTAGINVYDLLNDTEHTLPSTESFYSKGQMRGPTISGDKIVWLEYGNNSLEVFIYDLTSNTKKQLTDDLVDQSNLAVWENKVVWQAQNSIYVYDLSVDKERRIGEGADPSIFGNKIVYEKSRIVDGVAEIYLYDLLTGSEYKIWSPKDNLNSGGLMPVISGDLIAWVSKGRDGGILIYDLKNNRESKISANVDTLFVSENKIVWMTPQTPNYDIYFYEYRRN